MKISCFLLKILFLTLYLNSPVIVLHKKYFSKNTFVKLAEEFVLVELDFPKNKEILRKEYIDVYMELRKKYNAQAFPTVIVLDTDENVIARTSGFRGKDTKSLSTHLLTAALEGIL